MKKIVKLATRTWNVLIIAAALSYSAFPAQMDTVANAALQATIAQVDVVQIVDPSKVDQLWFEEDLTPALTLSANHQEMVVESWGWEYPNPVSFRAAQSKTIEPTGASYKAATRAITARTYTNWGEPGAMQVHFLGSTPQTIRSLNIAGRGSEKYLIRSSFSAWIDEDLVNLRINQVAVGKLGSKPTPFAYRRIPDDVVISKSPPVTCFVISDVFLAKDQSFVSDDQVFNGNSWKVVAYQSTIDEGELVTFGPGFNFWEPNPLITKEKFPGLPENEYYYLHYAGHLWNPTRLIGEKLCPSSLSGPVFSWQIE